MKTGHRRSNKPHAPNPAITLWFQFEYHWRRVSDAGRCAVLIAILVLVGCDNPDQKQIASWASKSIEWKDQADGTLLVTFATPYFYGDKVRFDSVNGRGTGFIDGIVLAQDGTVYYTVQDEVRRLDDGQPTIQEGIYPDEITLIQRAVKHEHHDSNKR